MRINVFVNKFPAYSETFIYNQVQGFIKKGFKVTLYCQSVNKSEDSSHESIEFVHQNCEIVVVDVPYRYREKLLKLAPTIFHVIRKSGWKSLRILNIFSEQDDNKTLVQVYMAKAMVENPPEGLIICHFGVHGVLLTTLAKAGVFKPHDDIVTYFHGCDFSSYVAARSDRIYENLFAYGSKFIANSEFTRNKLIALGAEPSKVIKIPVGYNDKIFTYYDRQDLKLSPVIFMSIGRLTEKKGHQYLIAAFRKVLDSGLEAKLIIVGEGNLESQLLDQIHDLNLNDSVELLGRKSQKEIKELLQSVHVFVLASVTASNGDTEGQGLVLQEAQAVGLPVIATDHNGFPDSLQDKHTGFLVPERDSDILAQKMCLLGFEPNLRHKMGRAGAEFAKENFSSEVISALTEEKVLNLSAKH